MEAKILLVDGDRWARRVVVSALADRGYSIAATGDGFAGLARALAEPPDLVISEVLLPGMCGWRMLRKLRSYRACARTPVMFLTGLASDASRRHSYRLGADDYVLRPCHPEELVLRVEGVLRRVRGPSASARALASGPGKERGRGLSGAIEDISLASLLVLLEMERKTGMLVLNHPVMGRRCRVFLRDGRVVGAYLDGDTSQRHAELLCRVLHWSTGEFEFRSVLVEMDDEVRASTTHLLLEAARRRDEAGADERECSLE